MQGNYFNHFSSLKNDMKLRRLWKQMGPEGYGIYMRILEVLCDEEDNKISVDDIDILSSGGVAWDEARVRDVIFDYNLFEIKGGYFWSPDLTVRSTKKTTAGLVRVKKDSKSNRAIAHYKGQLEAAQKSGVESKYVDGYKNLIRFIFGKNETEEPLEKVLFTFSQQLTFEQYMRLKAAEVKYKANIADTLLDMENWGNPKKRKSVYLTALKFMQPKEMKFS